MPNKLLSLLVYFLGIPLAYASPNVEAWSTQNGARVMFVAAPQLPMVDIRVVFDAGGARDAELPGLALMTNTMLAEGAADRDADAIADAFADVGAEFGSSAERDMAVLSLRSLTDSEPLTQALETFLSVMSQPAFPEASLERLRNQFLLGLQAENQSPAAIATRQFYAGIYPSHPYGQMPNGTPESIQAIQRSDLLAFHSRFYVARNAVIALVGDLTREQAEAISEQIASALHAGEAAPGLPEVEPAREGSLRQIEHPCAQTHIMMGQAAKSRHDPDYFPLYVGNHILGGSGLVSQLSGEIREKRGLSYAVYSYFRPMRQAGPYQFVLQTRNDQAQEALRVMQDTLKRFVELGPTEAELESAKRHITGGFALRVDSNRKIAEYLAMLAFYDLPTSHLTEFNDQVLAVTREAIIDAYQRRIDPNQQFTVMVGGNAEP